MKLSSLNKFKGQEVTGVYWDNMNKEELEFNGEVEDVEEDGITIEDKNGGLQKIPIQDIRQISELLVGSG